MISPSAINKVCLSLTQSRGSTATIVTTESVAKPVVVMVEAESSKKYILSSISWSCSGQVPTTQLDPLSGF